jgi:hypothetical protein
MSRIRDLKTNTENMVNIVDIIEMFIPDKKSKYTDMVLRLMKLTPNMEEHRREIIDYFKNSYNVEASDIEKFNGIQLLVVYKFVESFFNSNDLEMIRKFCEYNERNLISQNDLTQYKTFEDVSTQVNIADIKVEMRELENEVVRVHEDDEWLLVRPMTFLASKKYGSNTKWCTTSENNPEYFLKYAERGVLIYCMNKKTGYKVASFYSLKKSDPEFSFWNQKDEKIESMDSELSDSMLRIIREISKDAKTKSNRKLLNETQLEKENKSLEKYMGKTKIQEIIREFGVHEEVVSKSSMGNRLSNRIQNALRREEPIEELDIPLPIPQESNPWIFNRDDDVQESETTVFEQPREF